MINQHDSFSKEIENQEKKYSAPKLTNFGRVRAVTTSGSGTLESTMGVMAGELKGMA